MKTSSLFFFVILAFSFACDDNTAETLQDPSANAVNLSALEAGQKSVFKRYVAQCSDLDATFKYVQEVLTLEVMEEEGAFRFKETLSNTNTSVDYSVKVIDDEMIIPDRLNSSLFFFYGNDVIQLKPKDEVALAQDGCRLMIEDEIFIGNEIGVVGSLQLGPIVQKDKTAVSCVPGWIGEDQRLEAYLVYDSQELLMSHTLRNDNDVTGWVLAN